MVRAELKDWLYGPPLAGPAALAGGIVAVALATAVRAAVAGMVTGCEYTPYLLFVLLSAILMRWWHAALVALASVTTFGFLFVGGTDQWLASACFVSSSAIFLAASAAMIVAVILARHLFQSIQRQGADESAGGVVFSLKDGEVWASWYGQGPPVLLGSQPKVSRMMEDFLAQVEVGKRLNGKH